MITRNELKYIKGLQSKKNRRENHQFVVEGEKLVSELLDSDYKIHAIYATEACSLDVESVKVSPAELERMSGQRSPHNVLAVADQKPVNDQLPDTGVFIALQAVRDPGNLGTILRSVRWFGITGLILSPDCVDLYNPKTLRASMGAAFNIPVIERPVDSLKDLSDFNLYVLDLDGKSLYNTDIDIDKAIYIFGNESQGLSTGGMDDLTKITIPGAGKQESLNVAMSATICMSEIFRKRSKC